jgi:pilus assembly protein CpaF
MFGKKGSETGMPAAATPAKPVPEKPVAAPVPKPVVKETKPSVPPKVENKSSAPFEDDMFKPVEIEPVAEGDGADNMATLRLTRARNRIWLDLRDGIDLKALARMKAEEARAEVNSAVEEIARFRNLDLTPAELAKIAKECGDDMLGFGPLEELLERDDIADIMINGPDIDVYRGQGAIERTRVKFRDNQHLTTIAQRIVGAIGVAWMNHRRFAMRVCRTGRV